MENACYDGNYCAVSLYSPKRRIHFVWPTLHERFLHEQPDSLRDYVEKRGWLSDVEKAIYHFQPVIVGLYLGIVGLHGMPTFRLNFPMSLK